MKEGGILRDLVMVAIGAVVALICIYLPMSNSLTEKIAAKEDKVVADSVEKRTNEELGKLHRSEKALCEHLDREAEEAFGALCTQANGIYNLNSHVCTPKKGASSGFRKICNEDL